VEFRACDSRLRRLENQSHKGAGAAAQGRHNAHEGKAEERLINGKIIRMESNKRTRIASRLASYKLPLSRLRRDLSVLFLSHGNHLESLLVFLYCS
jgi:hypothetical protein